MKEYSVIIRTTGQAGKKYELLLNSISKLEPQPNEVIIVLPNGYDLPKERLGYEVFEYSQKGMISQRLHGINACKTQYALICDDDVTFGIDFVTKLQKPVEEGLCSISAAPLLSFLPSSGKGMIIDYLFGAAIPIIKKNMYCTVISTSGYAYNRRIDTSKCKYYEAESMPWTCFFADIEALKQIKLQDEIWLESHGYAALDDQTMFYKAHLMGIKTLVVSDAEYQHLDAKTSTKNNKENVSYASTYNRVIFWHRFIYNMREKKSEKLWSYICFKYRMLWVSAFNMYLYRSGRMTKECLKAAKQGYKDGMKYITSQEYKDIPFVVRNNR